MNAGQIALDKMRREQTEKRDAELRKVQQLIDIDQQLASSPASGVIPEQVATRMGMRMLPFVGVPLFGTMSVFIAFWYFAKYQNTQVETSLVAFSTIAVLVLSLVVKCINIF
jgi:hypothetical protein